MAGKIISQPRTNCAFSDSHIKEHKYSTAEAVPTQPWLPEIEELRDQAFREWGGGWYIDN